ncbi:hypothetical protein SAMN05660816_06424 [Niastella yeongjuensis]|nr:hypothetical protein SAMN05660816_06424 [Niastella yeongjuensis]
MFYGMLSWLIDLRIQNYSRSQGWFVHICELMRGGRRPKNTNCIKMTHLITEMEAVNGLLRLYYTRRDRFIE